MWYNMYTNKRYNKQQQTKERYKTMYEEMMCEFIMYWIITFFALPLIYMLISKIKNAVKRRRRMEEAEAGRYIEAYVQRRIRQHEHMMYR